MIAAEYLDQIQVPVALVVVGLSFTLSFFSRSLSTTLSLLYFITQRSQGQDITCEVIKRTRVRLSTPRDAKRRRRSVPINLFYCVIIYPPTHSPHSFPRFPPLPLRVSSQLNPFSHQLHSLASLAFYPT